MEVVCENEKRKESQTERSHGHERKSEGENSRMIPSRVLLQDGKEADSMHGCDSEWVVKRAEGDEVEKSVRVVSPRRVAFPCFATPRSPSKRLS